VSLSEEQFREQLVDYLYGELEDAQREAFEASLAQSSERRAEVEALRATLRTARTGLSALHEDPPARARSAILDAERASRVRVLGRKPWYRRGATLTPLLAAAAALTFAVLSPRRDQPLHQEQVERAAAPEAPAPRQEAEGARDEVAPSGQQAEEGARDPLGERKRALEAASKGSSEPPRARKREQSRPGADKAPARRAASHDDVDGLSDFAEPPPGWGGGGLVGSGAAAPAAVKPAQEQESRGAADRWADAPAHPAPVASRPASAPRMAAQEASAESKADASSAADALVKRAREHVEARRWSEAVIAYRELLLRFPNDARAASWRSELGSAARALSAVPP
jgi:hypothetical protein